MRVFIFRSFNKGSLVRNEYATSVIAQFRDEDTVKFADIAFESYNCSDLTNEHINATG
jgi:hypothetical protein